MPMPVHVSRHRRHGGVRVSAYYRFPHRDARRRSGRHVHTQKWDDVVRAILKDNPSYSFGRAAAIATSRLGKESFHAR